MTCKHGNRCCTVWQKKASKAFGVLDESSLLTSTHGDTVGCHLPPLHPVKEAKNAAFRDVRFAYFMLVCFS